MQIEPDVQRLQWIASNLHIITKAGTRELLRPNVVQLRLHMCIQAQRQRNLPVRLRLLKFRQWGGSTWIEAEGFYEVYHNPNWRAMAVSVDADSTDHIFGMTKLFDDDMPSSLKKPKDNTNRKEIKYSKPHRSQFLAQTAGKMSLGHSFTAQFVHCSEISRWENAAIQMGGLQEIVPLKPGTTIIQETTANGQGGYFYDGWIEDVKRRRKHPDDYTGYIPVFVAWFMFPDYAIEPPRGFGFSKELRELQKRFNLTDAQIYWRHRKLEEMNGDIAMLMEQYPSTWEESFQVSGNPVFSPDIIAKQAMYQQERFKRVMFDEQSGKITVERTDELVNVWLFFREPQDDHEYVIGIDTMESRLSDVRNPKSSLDYDGITILDRGTGEVVAIYHGRGDQRELGRQAYRAAVYYNEAYVAPEIPQSMVLLSYFKERGYPYIYNRRQHEDREVETDSEVLGWRTTTITRKWLVEDFVVACKEVSIKLNFPELIDEMRTFVRNSDGKPEHLPGEHDDLLFSAMIALQCHKHVPHGATPLRQHHTGLGSEEESDDNDLARMGAVDTWSPEDDEDEEESDEELHSA